MLHIIFFSLNVYAYQRLSFSFTGKMQCWFHVLPLFEGHVVGTCQLF